MASDKQITFIQNLLDTREVGDLDNDGAARAVRAGKGSELSTRQASEFIEMLLTCPKAIAPAADTFAEKVAAQIAAQKAACPKKAPAKIGIRVALNQRPDITGTVTAIASNKAVRVLWDNAENGLVRNGERESIMRYMIHAI